MSENHIYTIPGLSIETSFVYDFISQGETKNIDYVNTAGDIPEPATAGAVFLFTEGNTVRIREEYTKSCVAVVADSNSAVIQVINKAPGAGIPPLFEESTDVAVPAGGFVILAWDRDYDKGNIRKFFAEKFSAGDIVKLKIGDARILVGDVAEMADQAGHKHAFLNLNGEDMYTTYEKTVRLEGSVIYVSPGSLYKIAVKKYGGDGKLIAKTDFAISGDKSEDTSPDMDILNFTGETELTDGVNYLDITLMEDGVVRSKTAKSLIIFKKKRAVLKDGKPVIMWVEQFVSARALNTGEKIRSLILTAKEAGITGFAIDVKGCEGYTVYKKSELSGAPYMTQTKDPKKQVDMDIDFLEEFIKSAHSYGMKIYASFNFFVEGNIAAKDFAVNLPQEHPGWAEVLQAPEDGGELKSVLETKRASMLLYVNPANEEVQEFELKRAEEVLKNYDVDGLVMDRTRYDHQYADFSEVTREKFKAYLEGQNKTLTLWPDDAYSVNTDGSLVQGKYYLEWFTFRSLVIRGFSDRLRAMADQYMAVKKRDIKLAAYVGSWYETYYQNGVNWADESFIYNDRLKFPLSKLYTGEYAKASYISNIDFLMIGCYYPETRLIEKYITLGNILTNDRLPLIGSVSIPDLKTPEALRNGFQTVYGHSGGAMIFDLCYTEWDKLSAAIRDEEYTGITE